MLTARLERRAALIAIAGVRHPVMLRTPARGAGGRHVRHLRFARQLVAGPAEPRWLGMRLRGAGWLTGAADDMFGDSDDVVLSGDLFEATAGRLGQHEGEQRAEDRDPGGEQQRAA